MDIVWNIKIREILEDRPNIMGEWIQLCRYGHIQLRTDGNFLKLISGYVWQKLIKARISLCEGTETAGKTRHVQAGQCVDWNKHHFGTRRQ
jgi:hypothetical protein